MPKCLVQGTYTAEGLRIMDRRLRDSARAAAAETLLHAPRATGLSYPAAPDGTHIDSTSAAIALP